MMLIDLKDTDKAALRQKTLQKAPLRSSGKIGSDIRALRRSRNWTLNDLAEQLDRSVGWLSQVERNVSEPALDDIRKIAGLFSLPVSFSLPMLLSAMRPPILSVLDHGVS